jgi:hypothetical protein
MGPHRFAAGLLLVLAGAFGWLFYERYWKWRECIREALSSCLTPDGDNLTAGGMLRGVIAAILAVAALRSALRG